MIDRNDPTWYRDAVIYQVHVKSFFDASDNGIGDFAGLTERLDYVKELGATAIWVMPFYPSPLRDDGYDIADYRNINPSYGTMRDFRRFVREAHDRDLRVIIELVINHTSDQHPWFQKARRAKPGSAARNFYVWSDTDQKYTDARIIFIDTEPSNWTWDPVAKAYFWHRFYSHQPDLNFDNPRVLEAVLDTMRYWCDMGVDGLRLDAIPYLVERDGTNCENLPETHAILKKIRAVLDAEYPTVMLLAEANQWPEETAEYFGSSDECHMAFHFPLMPRMYMAVAQEDRLPVTDIMRQTPDPPAGAQWAIFLRNHDELTLEMVTDRERDYLWSFYAADKRARINRGIRRRLAPLLGNDRRKIELMNSLLFSMPGTPVLYYGDEIGMGDNIYLGDRDGVRTPMQWSPDRNGGFSKANPAQLFLPAIQDPIYGYEAVNVEAQRQSPASLLNWMRRIIAVSRNNHAFGRGTLRFLYPSNRKVLAYIREYEDQRIVCVANVSRAPQAVELDLTEFRGCTPVELLGGSAFPPVGELPYLLTLAGYGFYWFSLGAGPVDEARFGPATQPELFTLVLTGRPDTLLKGRERAAFERTAAPRFLGAQRWFAAKGMKIAGVTVDDSAVLKNRAGQETFVLPLVAVDLKGAPPQHYFMPLALDEGREDEALVSYAVARIRRGAKVGLLYDAGSSAEFGQAVLEAIKRNETVPTAEGGSFRFTATSALPRDLALADGDVRRMSVEQSNTSINFADEMVLKIYRRLTPGIHPEVEVGRFLTDVAGFRNTPPLFGAVEHIAADGTPTGLAILQRFIRNQGDAATFLIEGLKRELDTMMMVSGAEAAPAPERYNAHLVYARLIGRRTGELHAALAIPTDDAAFAAEPLGTADIAATAADARAMGDAALAAMERALPKLDRGRDEVETLIRRRKELARRIDGLAVAPEGAIKTRVHGDYHLGQVLIVRDDVMIVDFEGEPGRTGDERRLKDTPLRDVAGMLRSYAYAAEIAAHDLAQRFAEAGPAADAAAAEWRRLSEAAFLSGYEEAATGSPVWIADPDARAGLLKLHLLSRALYEIVYEATNRPDWITTPVRGVLAILDEEAPS